MWKRVAPCVGTMGLVVAITSATGFSHAGILDHIPTDPPTLTQVARTIDHIQSQILNQGTVVIKQPDIWSQARMTKFRKEFEDTMSPEVNNFKDYLSGQLARSDSASFSSQTALAATLNPVPSGTTIQNTASLAATTKAGSTDPLAFPAPAATSGTTAASDFTLLNTVAPGAPGAKAGTVGIALSVEPNVHLDEEADYITHLHRLRRINLGDDNADSAGYGLYLMRVPISLIPGDKTVRGYGAVVSLTMRHEFSPNFLPSTYRNLVINDVIDLLAPVIHELIRSGRAKQYRDAVIQYPKRKARVEQLKRWNRSKLDALPAPVASPPVASLAVERAFVEQSKQDPALKDDSSKKAVSELDTDLIELEKGAKQLATASNFHPVGRLGSRTLAIAPSDVRRVFVAQNLSNLAYAAQEALDLGNSVPPATNRVRLTDVYSYLRQELEGAYDLMEGRSPESPPVLMDVEYVEKLADQVYSRKFEGPKGAQVDSEKESNDFSLLYEGFTHRLPGNLRTRPIGVLCWAIALDAGLLNRQLRIDMLDTKGPDGSACPPEVDRMFFYTPRPAPETVAAFEGYIQAKWPMITFALEPITDQQNIEDAFTRRRDLQLAVAFALSSGQINFRQAIQYTRTLQYEAQTIALNQTVSAFAHGNDTFGWRISPRFQTPPEESNLRAVTNLLLRGGPGPNYGLKNSKIEPGLREMTAVVVMPSFVRAMRIDAANNWFRLHDPDDYKLHSARSVELGRKINEARAALEYADTCGAYRHEDVERLRVRLHQLEAMLPLQTAHVKVPYENTLGGFALFTQGATALVPELSGHEGIEYIDPSRGGDIIVYGKHFSIYESAVVVGGVALSREGLGRFVITDPNTNKNTQLSSTLTPLRNPDGSLFVVMPNGAALPVKDVGSYDILSREVMRVRIPPGVRTATREDGSTIVELYLATATGISNRLQIPVDPGLARAGAAGKPGYVVLTDTLAIPLTAHAVPGAPPKNVYDLPPAAFTPDFTVRLQPIGPGPVVPASASVTMTFPTSIGLVTRTIANVRWDGAAYAINATQLNTFATELVALLKSNNLLPDPPPPASFLTSKSITVVTDPEPNLPATSATTVNPITINLQANVVPGKTSALAPAPSGTALAATSPRPATGAPASQVAGTSIPLPRPIERTSDPLTRPAAFQPAAMPDLSALPLPPHIEALPGRFQTLSDYTAALSERTAVLSAQVSTALNRPAAPPTVVMVPSQGAPPVVNVAVPVTSLPPIARRHKLFHRGSGSAAGLPGRP